MRGKKYREKYEKFTLVSHDYGMAKITILDCIYILRPKLSGVKRFFAFCFIDLIREKIYNFIKIYANFDHNNDIVFRNKLGGL
jgi:hypothetical protein